jgi:fructose-1,6-bisphosphatase/inositol monophosphatase family enzyme
MTPAALDAAMLALLRDVAAKAIMPYYRKLAVHEVEEKAADDVVTVADRFAEDMLAQGLERIVPGLAVVGEEAAYADPAVYERLSQDCWIVDPIDGTSNFAAGEGHFAIMVALGSGGVTQSGWIYDPRRDRLLAAHRGVGAFCDGGPAIASPSGRKPPRLSAMTRFMAPEQRSLFEREIAPHYSAAEAPRCAAEQYPLVGFGEHDLAIYERTLAWDHAPGALWLHETGGVAARPDGTPYRLDDGRKGLIAATGPQIFEEFADRLARSGYAPGA